MSVFECKSREELEKMDAADIGKYYAEKDAHNDNVIKGVVDRNEALQKNYEELSKFSQSQKDLIEKNANQLKAQAERIAAQKNSITTYSADWLTEGLESNLDKLKAMQERSLRQPFKIKAVGDMTKPVNISNNSLLPVPDVENSLTRIQRRRPWISTLIRTGRTSSDKFQYHDQSGVEGAPGRTAEGAIKNQIDFDITVTQRFVEKYTDYIRVSDEMLADVGFMRSEIQNELIERLRLAVDADQLSGTGTNELFGLLTDATAYASGALAATVPEPNNVDVLTAAMNQIMLANFMPTVILMNPTDVTQIKLDKASDGHYLGRLLTTADGMTLDGVPIVENTGMPQDTFLVMDGTKPSLYEREPVNILFGMNGNDFIENMQTIRAEWRGVQVVRTNHKPALVTGTFSAAITELTKP